MFDRLFAFVGRWVLRIERPRSPVVLFAFLAALLVLQMWPARWIGNEEDYFQLAYRTFAPEHFFHFSAVFDSSHARFLPLYLLGFVVHLLGYDWAHVVCRILMGLLYAAGLAYFFSALRLSAWDALLVIVLFLRAGEQLIGGEWLFAGVESKTVAYAFLLFAFGLALRRRWIAATVAAAAATYMHFLVGGFWTLGILLWQWLETKTPRELLRSLAVYAIVTLPLAGLIAWDELAWAASPVAALADKIYTTRNAWHVAPFASRRDFWEWTPGVVNTLALVLVLGAVESRHRATSPSVALVSRTALLGLAYLLVALAAAFLDRHTQLLGKLFLFRPSSLILLLALTTIVALLFAPLSEGAAGVKALVVCALVISFSWVLFKRNVDSTRATASAFPERGELVAAIVAHTAPGDVVLIEAARDGDPNYMRLVRELPRPTLVNWKFVPTNPGDIVRWQSYMDLRSELFAHGCGTRTSVPVRWLVTLRPGSAAKLAGCGAPVWQKGSVALIPLP
jgi:hypothetical protein